ncbi:MAG TPA: amino acid permease [Chthoniobacterales bacterium]|jgi:APA family basic amino acid/polyamine antiporter|nr:amino acid permease [Chthoniobacterales bacterium]
MASQFFRTKSPDHLMREAAAPERQMKRTLGAFDLTCIGIGAIIGSGIFAMTGTAAAGQTFSTRLETPVLNFIQAWFSGADVILGRAGAGPAIAVSFVVAAVACAFAALCYAELASMIPVSGSAYTYSYATLGEIIAWIIGWDLILEYAVGNMSVAVGWSGYFVQLCGSLGGWKFPIWLVNDHATASNLIASGGDALQNFSSTTLPVIAGHTIAFNLPALVIVVLVTVLLVYGIRESARANTAIVVLKVAVVVFVISFGGFMVNPGNWHPYMPNGFTGVMSGAAIVFFAFIGFDAVSTTAEETKRPQRDMPIGIIASLIICTLLYVLMSTVLTGIKKYTVYAGDSAAVATAFGGTRWAQALVSAGALAGMTSVLLVFQLGQPRIFMAMARDGLLPGYFSRIHPRYRTPHITTIWTGIVVGVVAMVTDIGSLADLTNIGTLFAFILVCFGVIILRRTDPARPRPFRVPMVPLFPIMGVIFCIALMLSLPVLTWIRFVVWLVIGLFIYFFYGAWHSRLQRGTDEGPTEDIVPPIVKP